MDIKEIALRLLAEDFPGMHQENQAFMVEFSEALIESYKAELLKEAGEPVAEFKRHPFGDYTELSFSAGYSARRGDKLYTSNQVAAAILKVTGPLKHELRELRMSTRMRGEDIDELRAQLAAAIASVKGEQ